ncbi:MAG: hypothetical protein QOG52_590 [Frankiaceae bacterium]|nr:hypothetical protein [Frankiaceae bacterium]
MGVNAVGQRRSVAVRLTITAMLAASLSACSSNEPDPDNVAICVDPNTQQRVDDSQCGADLDHHIGSGGIGSGFLWYFIGRNSAFPPVGGRYLGTGGSFSRPANIGSTIHGVGGAGGTVSRGGFGGTAHGGSS